MIKQRLRLLACSVMQSVGDEKIAWRTDKALPLVWSESRRYNYWRNVKKVCVCIYGAFCKTNQFYDQYLVSKLLMTVLTISFDIIFTVTTPKPRLFVILGILNTSMALTPLILCTCLTNEFKNMQGLIYGYHWTHKRNIGRRKEAIGTSALFKWAHIQQTFDCGYFEMDLSLLRLMLDVLVLVVLSCLPLYM